jgi:hypothetical protein
MRLCLWFSAAALVVAGTGAWCWYEWAGPCCESTCATSPQIVIHRLLPPLNDDAESCDLLEPLRVEDTVPPVPTWDASDDNQYVPRVAFDASTQQPPRPDAEQGRHMPYADEEGNAPLLSWTNVRRVFEFAWSRLNFFGGSEPEAPQNPAEESETPGEQAPEALQMPEPDYHRNDPQHCPYHGGCPYPYYRR